jgi:hypothetical protein
MSRLNIKLSDEPLLPLSNKSVKHVMKGKGYFLPNFPGINGVRGISGMIPQPNIPISYPINPRYPTIRTIAPFVSNPDSYSTGNDKFQADYAFRHPEGEDPPKSSSDSADDADKTDEEKAKQKKEVKEWKKWKEERERMMISMPKFFTTGHNHDIRLLLNRNGVPNTAYPHLYHSLSNNHNFPKPYAHVQNLLNTHIRNTYDRQRLMVLLNAKHAAFPSPFG